MTKKGMIEGIGARITEVRGHDSQGVFAAKIGVSLNAVSNYERGERIPTVETLAQIAKLSGKSIGWLVFGKDDKPVGKVDSRKLAMALRMVREERPGLSLDKEIAAALTIYNALIEGEGPALDEHPVLRKGA